MTQSDLVWGNYYTKCAWFGAFGEGGQRNGSRERLDHTLDVTKIEPSWFREQPQERAKTTHGARADVPVRAC